MLYRVRDAGSHVLDPGGRQAIVIVMALLMHAGTLHQAVVTSGRVLQVDALELHAVH